MPRFIFDGSAAAAEALATILLDARETTADYSFGPLTISKILASGLVVTGDTNKISSKLGRLPGVIEYEE